MAAEPTGRRDGTRERTVPDSAWVWLAAAGAAAVIVWAIGSYVRGGIVHAVLAAASDNERSLAILREYIAKAGPFGPAAYVLAVVAEVLIAPLPGTLLYAPGGALFGGFMGGCLSLAGNVIGATLACVLARVLGERLSARLDGGGLTRYIEMVRRRSLWIVLLLRLNPLTSSDLVSYAAGFARVPVWHVTVGTLVGMAPLCFAQSYAAEGLFRLLPGSGLVLVGLGLVYLGLVLWVVLRFARSGRAA